MRALMITVASAALLASTGCVAVSAKDNRVGVSRQAVVINDKVYIVDLEEGELYEFPTSHARPMPRGRYSEDVD